MRTSPLTILAFLLPCLLLCGSCGLKQGHFDLAENDAAPGTLERVFPGRLVDIDEDHHTITCQIRGPGAIETIKLQTSPQTRGLSRLENDQACLIRFGRHKKKFIALELRPFPTKYLKKIKPIQADALAELLASAPVHVLDLRPADRFHRSHLSGALQVNRGAVKTLLAEHRLPKQDWLVITAEEMGCGGLIDAARAAERAGYKKIRVFFGGRTVWRKAGYPLYADIQGARQDNVVLIDLRKEHPRQQDCIPGAVALPLHRLAQALTLLPRQVPLILYSDSEKEANQGLSLCRQEGYQNSAILKTQDWLTNGDQLPTGNCNPTIRWPRHLRPGEISIAGFKQGVLGRLDNTAILDVRTREEVARGALQNVLHIPLAELSARLGELDRQQHFYIYSATGARAELAADILRAQGFHAFFLAAHVSCQGKACTISYQGERYSPPPSP